MSTQHKPKEVDINRLKLASEKRFAIVYSEWNPEIINRLLSGAISFFNQIGLDSNDIDK